jgi:tetratricopeptide (TPR) repeat protein
MRTSCLIVFAFILFSGPASGSRAQAGCPDKVTSTNPFVNLPCPTDDPGWAKAFSLWDRRADDDELMAAVRIFESLAKDKPDSLEARLWLTRSYYLVAVRERGPKKEEWARKAEAEADRALKLEEGNEFALHWRWCAIILYRQFSEAEFDEIRAFGEKYGHLWELPVPEDDPLWAKAIIHWDARYQYDEGLKAIALFEELEKRYPDRIEPKLWLLRSNYWMHYIEPAEDGKARWCKIAVDWGRKALDMEPRNPAVNYLIAGALGQYGSHTSFLNYVRYSLEIAQRLTITMEEDPNFYYGGISQYLALAIARAGALVEKTLGVVGFDMDLILRSTIFASKKEPRYLRNFYALGELYIKQGRMDEARDMLETVINSDPSALWQMEPENRVAQKLAKELLDEHFHY